MEITTLTKTALITGASAGLGVEFARQLAAQGVNLVLVARRGDVTQALADSISAEFRVETRVLPADLSDPSAPETIFKEMANANVAIDYLINNAGAGGPDLVEESDWSEQAKYLQLMMFSVTELNHKFLPGMRARGFGRVINVASVAGRFVRGGDTNYGPSKAYLIALSEGLRHLRSEGVHVSALCPGFTHTDFHADGELAEMKAGLPKFVWYDADVVVRDGLRAVEQGKSICISGRLYRWLDFLLQSKLLRPLLTRFA